MLSRQMEGDAYRYGFNGKENDRELKGDGSQQDYGMRIYDPRMGRFLSVDPLFKNFAWYTPYQFSGNTPIQSIDLDGLEPKNMVTNNGRLTEPIIKLYSTAFYYDENMLRNLKFFWTNRKFKLEDNVPLVTTRGGIIINRTWHFDYIGSSWESFWFGNLAHELTHVKQFKDHKNLKNKFSEDLLESTAYHREDVFRNYMETENFENLFDERWSDDERSGFAAYLGLGFRIVGLKLMAQTGNKKIEELRSKLGETTKKNEKKVIEGKIKKLENGVERIQKMI